MFHRLVKQACGALAFGRKTSYKLVSLVTCYHKVNTKKKRSNLIEPIGSIKFAGAACM